MNPVKEALIFLSCFALGTSSAFLQVITWSCNEFNRLGQQSRVNNIAATLLFATEIGDDENSNYCKPDGENITVVFDMYRGIDKNTDDDIISSDEIPYGRRSEKWTKRYRKLIPYDMARQKVMTLGLRSKSEWDEFVADGKRGFGPYLPNRPDEMYADDWISWDEFLGLMRPYNETREIVGKVLKLKSMEEYIDFVKADIKRAEGLRIPAKPDIVYKKKGWISERHFFGESDH